MKKWLSMLLVFMMMFTLTACGGGDTQQEANNNDVVEEQNNDGGLFDIADTDIRAYASDLTTTLTGDEAAAQKAVIPAEIKKGVGEVAAGLCTIAPDYSNDGTYNFGVIFLVPKNEVSEYYKVLTDYYKSLDGTVTSEWAGSSTQLMEMEFAWGKMYQCETGVYNDEYGCIKVGFDING